MKIFFDTEFYEDGKTIDLMSIGMVREDGQELYRINADHDWNRSLQDIWHCKHTLPSVLPQLIADVQPSKGIKDLGAVRGGTALAFDVYDFCGPYPEFWSYYADYDWVVLCQLFGRMISLPDDWPKYCRDFKQLCDEHGHKPRKQEEGEHNALSDALWLKKEYDYFHKL